MCRSAGAGGFAPTADRSLDKANIALHTTAKDKVLMWDKFKN